jgi:hypothetical protein
MKTKAIITITVPGDMEDVRDSIVIEEFLGVLRKKGIHYRVCTSVPGWHNREHFWFEFECMINNDFSNSIKLDLNLKDSDDKDIVDDFYDGIKWGKIVMIISKNIDGDIRPL